MVKGRQEPSAKQLDALRGQIQDCRDGRKAAGPMPGKDWEFKRPILIPGHGMAWMGVGS